MLLLLGRTLWVLRRVVLSRRRGLSGDALPSAEAATAAEAAAAAAAAASAAVAASAEGSASPESPRRRLSTTRRNTHNVRPSSKSISSSSLAGARLSEALGQIVPDAEENLAATAVASVRACIGALRKSEDTMMQWYFESFGDMKALLRSESVAFFLSQQLRVLYSGKSHKMSPLGFEVLTNLVLLALAAPAGITRNALKHVDRIACELLPVIDRCFVDIDNTQKYLYHPVHKLDIWHDRMFWESSFFRSLEKQLTAFHQANDSLDDMALEQREEAVVHQEIGVFMSYQVHLGVLDDDIRSFLKYVGYRCNLPKQKLEGLLSTLPIQIKFFQGQALRVHRKHPERSLLPDAQAKRPNADDAAGRVFVQSELLMESFKNIVAVSPPESGGSDVLFARGTVHLTNYRVVFQGAWARSQALREDRVTDDGDPFVSAIPVAAISRVNWFDVESIAGSCPKRWAQQGLMIKSTTFQVLRLCANEALSGVLSSIQARVSRVAFYLSINDTFAMFTGVKLGFADQDREKISNAVRRALTHQASTAADGHQPTVLAFADIGKSVGQLAAWDSPNNLAYVQDLHRLGVSDTLTTADFLEVRSWRLERSNNSYRLCATYPATVCVPGTVGSKDLADYSGLFQMQRFPILSWLNNSTGAALLRSATPRSDNGRRNLLYAVLDCIAATYGSDKFRRMGSLTGRRTRPRRHSIGNRAESVPFSHRFFLVTEDKAYQAWLDGESGLNLGWDGIVVDREHTRLVTDVQAVQNAAELLQQACFNIDADDSFLQLDASQWHGQVSALLHWANNIADVVELENATVLISLETGQDHTAQLSSLVQLLVDPYYRTLSGFIALVKKEWCAMGHSFASRAGLRSQNHAGGHKAMVFLQFLDAVHQILVQYPLLFEFNNYFLMTLAYHTCSMRFGTFLHDCEAERANALRHTSMSDLWQFLESNHEASPEYFNFLFYPQKCIVRPQSRVCDLKIWSYFFPDHVTGLAHDGTLPVEQYEPACHLMWTNLKQWAAAGGTEDANWYAIWAKANSNFGGRRERLRTFTTKRRVPTELKGKLTGWQALETFTHPHTFRQGRAIGKYCDHCKRFMWRCWQCSDCGVLVHDHCQLLMPHNCPGSRPASPEKNPFESFGRVRRGPSGAPSLASGVSGHGPVPQSPGLSLSRFSLGEAALGAAAAGGRASYAGSVASEHADYRTEGDLYKVGAVVKSWRFRHFVLDMETGQLRYYAHKNNQLKGCIYLVDITAVYTRDAYSKSLQGCYIELVTPKRTYVLRAKDEDDRSEWVRSLRHAARCLSD
eukprot:m.227558 g.227558  ORF g.227558 m.227558 type:complete len:1293 (+) comp22371_c1_seq4:3650-7528(+)